MLIGLLTGCQPSGLTTDMSNTIEVVQLDDGEEVYALTLSTAPYGEATFLAPDATDDSRRLLAELAIRWDALWPDMLQRLQDQITEYNTPHQLGSDEFQGHVSRMEPDVYMGDQSDIHVRLIFEQFPLWDYFIRDTEIVHFQPVY
jgi:hypothetical protein